MTDIEPLIKAQYAKFFGCDDYSTFKTVAEYYFKAAAFLKRDDVDAQEELKLWIRNTQKRLFIGIACELLVKSVYLYKGYGINKPLVSQNVYQLSSPNDTKYDVNDTFTLNYLIDHLHHVHQFSDIDLVKRGLKIAKAFRNKEGHVTTLWHDFDPINFTDIEKAVIKIYDDVFQQKLDFQVSMEKNEMAKFNLSLLN